MSALNKDTRAEAIRARELQARNLDNADSILQRWDQGLKNNNAKGTSRSQWEQDKSLFEQARKDFEGKGEFDTKMAEKAHDGGIRRELGTYATNREFEQALTMAAAKQEQGIKNLAAMNKKTEERKSNHHSIGEGNYEVDLAKARRNGSSEGGVDTADSVNGSEKKKSSLSLTVDGAPNTAISERERKSRLRDGLRDTLARKLAEEAAKKKNDALDGKAFTGALAGNGVNPDLGDGKSQTEILSEMISTGKGEKFTLSGSETDKEVSRMLASVDGKDEAGGILSQESLDLFARVKNVHKACEQRECVRLSRK